MSGWHGTYVKRARAYLAMQLPAICPRCGRIITPQMQWDVGHIIDKDIAPELMHDPTNWRAEHSRCNRQAGAAYGNKKRRIRRRYLLPTSRTW